SQVVGVGWSGPRGGARDQRGRSLGRNRFGIGNPSLAGPSDLQQRRAAGRRPARPDSPAATQWQLVGGLPPEKGLATEGGEVVLEKGDEAVLEIATESVTPRWRVLWTHSNCEQLVADQLAARGFDPFLPTVETWCRRGGV